MLVTFIRLQPYAKLILESYSFTGIQARRIGKQVAHHLESFGPIFGLNSFNYYYFVGFGRQLLSRLQLDHHLLSKVCLPAWVEISAGESSKETQGVARQSQRVLWIHVLQRGDHTRKLRK
jgi:hypothetical protein